MSSSLNTVSIVSLADLGDYNGWTVSISKHHIVDISVMN